MRKPPNGRRFEFDIVKPEGIITCYDVACQHNFTAALNRHKYTFKGTFLSAAGTDAVPVHERGSTGDGGFVEHHRLGTQKLTNGIVDQCRAGDQEKFGCGQKFAIDF